MPRLRNRKKLKFPRRFEDEDLFSSSPRKESPEESPECSELEEELFEPPKAKKPKPKRNAYRGPVIDYNPNLPPAAFPTLDHPDYVHNGGNKEVELTKDLPAMTAKTAESTGRASHDITQTSIAAQKKSQRGMPSNMHGEPTDNRPQKPKRANNIALKAAARRMSDFVLEMESSDDEDANISAKSASSDGAVDWNDPPGWNDLTTAHKLDLADTIAESQPNLQEVMQVLRLSTASKDELVKLLAQREEREAREETNQQRLQEQTRNILLRGGSLSQAAFHQMVEENLYGRVDEDDHLQTNVAEMKKARAYLMSCGLDSSLADHKWRVPSISNVTSGKKPRPVQSKHKMISSSIATQSPPGPSEEPSSRRSAQFAPSQEAPYPPNSRVEPMQQHKLSQHRPAPADLIAQHSPPASLSNNPVHSLRSATGSQSRNIPARSQGTMRVPQASLTELRGPSNASASTDIRPFDDPRFKAHGVLGSLNTQEELSLPAGSHSLAPIGSSAARQNHNRRSNTNPNPGPST